MDMDRLLSQMIEDAARIRVLVEGVSEQQARWRPDPDSWSMLEVINHLLDEEREDFRVRLDYILHRPGQPAPPIDPGGWVAKREYNQRDPDASLAQFLSEREASIAWLRELSAPDWDATYKAPWGSISAGDIFVSWVAHDLLHMRQLVELHWTYTTAEAAPYRPDYAGDW
ncbi:MAG: DinB family protein [Anaerolineae bacterium]